MNTSDRILLGAVLVLGLACIVGAVSSRSKAPQIVVNMPADAKPLSVLESNDKVIGPDRAVLWWTIYESTRKTRPDWPVTAANIADQAVLSVYGPPPKSP